MIDRFIRGGNFACSRLSVICWVLKPKPIWAQSLCFCEKSGSDLVLGSNVVLCCLSLAVACDYGLT